MAVQQPETAKATQLAQASVRYIKNGEGGKLWDVAKTHGQLHAGWSRLPKELIASRDYPRLRTALRRG